MSLMPSALPGVLCFDFDGLMVDTETPAFEAWCAIYRRHDAELPMEKWIHAVGTFHGFDPARYLEEITGRTLDRDSLFNEKERRKAQICESQPLLPGVNDRISEARQLGWGVAVVSTSDRPWVEGHLRRVGIFEHIDLFVTRENVTNVKPHPEPYLTAAKQFSINASRMVVFEDSPNGVRAAKSAGAICIAIPNPVTRGQDFSIADGVSPSLAEVSLAALQQRMPK